MVLLATLLCRLPEGRLEGGPQNQLRLMRCKIPKVKKAENCIGMLKTDVTSRWLSDPLTFQINCGRTSLIRFGMRYIFLQRVLCAERCYSEVKLPS